MSKTLIIRIAKMTIALILGITFLTYWQMHRMEQNAFALADAGRATAKTLGKVGKAMKTLDPAQVAAFIDESYQNPAQGRWQETLFADDSEDLKVYQWSEKEPGPVDKAGMVSQIADLLSRFTSLEKAKFKLAAIEELSDSHMVARTTLWMRGQRPEGATEEKLVFRIHLKAFEDGHRIVRQELVRGETVIGPGTGFTNVAASVGLDAFRAKRNPMFQTEEWRPKRFEIAQYSSAGVSVADYDNDGWEDLFFPNGDAAKLMRNTGDGSFEDTTVLAGLPDDLIGVNVALFLDLDNDGDKDLFMGRFTLENKLFRNNGDGTFTDVTEGAGLGGFLVAVAAAADYDNDQDLDIYLGRYLDPRTKLPTTPFYTRNSEGNALLRNNGDLTFTDVTEEAGVREGGLSLGTVWGDYDKDGHMDLYVANDFGRNALFRNRGDGTFEDVSLETGTLDLGFGMSATMGDVDNDGDLDIYVANVHSGQRWYGQAPTLKNYLLTSFREGTLMEDMPIYQDLYKFLGANWSSAGDHIIKGNSLLLNDGNGQFTDVAVAANANPFGWYWGSTMFDYDNDGRQDLYSANGWISAHNIEDY